jgi:capsular polysaccharide biosynthesis protein
MVSDTTVFRRCRSVWGSADERPSLPGAITIADVRYVPDGAPVPWGLYKGDQRIYEVADAVATGAARYGFDGAADAADGPYLYVGLLILHYGHFIIDTLSRLWPMLVMTGRRPKILCHRLEAYPEGPEHAFLYAMLSGLGIRREDVVSFDRTTRISQVILAERSFHERSHVHAIFGDLCRAAGQAYRPTAPGAAVERPVYLSKTKLRSGMNCLVNEADLESALSRLGVDIVHPEELSFGAQVSLLAARGPILGPTTSAFHTAAFSAPGRRIIGLNWSYQINSNFLLFDKFNHTQAYYYWIFKTEYSDVGNFGVGWTIPDPRRVAHELLERVAQFDTLDRLDAAHEARRARRERRWTHRLRSWRRTWKERFGGGVRG